MARKHSDGYAYVYGNTVANPVYQPEERESRKRERRTSPQVRRNRRRAKKMNREYAIFLTLAFAMVMLIGVLYVKLQMDIIHRTQEISVLQKELTDLKEENTTRYNAVSGELNLDKVREKAQGELGMVYASPGQMIEYKNPVKDYVKRYKEIPKSGASSK